MLRPSLSDECVIRDDGIAGQVSPELMLRPSLSARCHLPAEGCHAQVSPELMLRPSLSARGVWQGGHADGAECRRSLCSGLR